MVKYYTNSSNDFVYKEEDGKVSFYDFTGAFHPAPTLRPLPYWTAGTLKSRDFVPMSEEEVTLFLLEN